MIKRFIAAISLFPMLALSSSTVIGSAEKVRLDDLKRNLDARIDTGATVSSIAARHIQVFKRNNQNWVSFEMFHPSSDLTVVIEKPLKGYKLVKQRASEQQDLSEVSHAKRPMVEMPICIAGKRIVTLFNLADRRHFVYPLLIGRETMEQLNVLIDPKTEFLHSTPCPKPNKDTPS